MLWPDTTSRTDSGILTIGGCALTDLAATFGTPLYIFDEATLVHRAEHVTAAFSGRYPNSHVAYGGKAYLGPAVIRIFARAGIGLDVVSGGELWAALKAGINPATIVMHGNNKPAAELRMALEQGVGLIVVDNAEEIASLEAIAADLYGQGPLIGTKVPVAIRLNPGVDVHTHAKISTGIVDSKFGFPLWDPSAQVAVGMIAASNHLSLQGLHMHLGSQLDEYNSLPEAIEHQVAFAAWIRDTHHIDITTYSPGGGLAIAYTEAETEGDPDEWAEVIISAYTSAWSKHDLAPGTIVVEPGRWLVGPAAVALYTVGSVKRIEGVRTYVAVDGGMADNIRPGMYDARYTATIASRHGSEPTEEVRIAGRFCESGDVLIQEITLPAMVPGDLLAIPAAGAYQLPMGSNYNAMPRPAVVMVHDGQATIIRHRETWDDVFRHDVFDSPIAAR